MALARLKDDSSLIGLTCFVLLIIMIGVTLYTVVGGGLHLYVAEARYEDKLVGVGCCVTKHPINLTLINLTRIAEELPRGSAERSLKQDFLEIIKDLASKGSGNSSSCTNGMIRYKQLPEGLRVIGIHVSSVNPNAISPFIPTISEY
ncbi:MAG: hypothetical protein F7C38_02390 [Desulfurococcales archaeon]|nr:hypothetical protein [Desulfurococcales archaeon]